jgi:hypothetical protein
MPFAGFRRPGPLFDPNLGQPQRVPPQPTPREMQMQAALMAAAPRGGGRGYQTGGAVGRNIMNPRAAGEEAMQRQRRMQWNERTTPVPAGWGAYGSPFSANARFPSPPGGWQGGGAVGRNMMNPRAGGEEAMQRQRRMQWNERTTPVPAGWGAYGSPFSENARFPTPPGGWQGGGAVDSAEALMAEREMLQQQLQTADEVTAQEILMQIMEINKELEMAAATGMAGGGIASLMGG